jgi:hypothetical protein
VIKYSQVVESYEAELDIEIYDPGVDLSLAPYYSDSLAIDLDEPLRKSVFEDILQMTAHAQRR